ncbi:5121_t:CDS:2, partial [Gigaspora margarita]
NRGVGMLDFDQILQSEIINNYFIESSEHVIKLTINTLRELNSRLVLQIDELRKENAEVKKNKTDTVKLTAENVELKDKVTKLEQKQTQVITNDQDASFTKDICNESKVSLSIQFLIEGQSDKNPDHFSELEHSPTRPESLAEFETFYHEILSMMIQLRFLNL